MSGTLTGHSLYSPSNERRFEHWVWTPDAGGPYPLLVLLHGVYDAGGFVWWQQGHAHETAAELIDSGTVPAFAVLMAGDTGAGQGSGYNDWADGTTRAETYLVDELLPWADANLDVAGQPRWITGLSMGGFGALMLALRHPGTFVSATATSGFFDPTRILTFVPEPAERRWGSEGPDPYDVRRLVEDTSRRAGLRIALDCGTDDDLLEENRAVHAQLDALGISHGYAEHPGGHEWTYWADHLADHIRFHAGVDGPLSR